VKCLGEGPIELSGVTGPPARSAQSEQGIETEGALEDRVPEAGGVEAPGKPDAAAYEVSHVATVSHALVPLSATRMNCEATIARPPQTYTAGG